MLQLPSNWPFMSCRSTASRLLRQVRGRDKRLRFLRCYLWAVIDVANELRAQDGNPLARISEGPVFTWHEKNLSYRMVFATGEHSMKMLQSELKADTWIITLVRRNAVVKSALTTLTNAPSVELLSIAQFMHLRLSFAAMFGGWCRSELCRNLFDAYNQRAMELKFGDLCVETPWI